MYLIIPSLCGGSASIPRRLNVTVHSSDDINYSTEKMEDERKMSPLSLSCNQSMPHMLVVQWYYDSNTTIIIYELIKCD